MEFTSENVIQAVHEFYQNSEKLNMEAHEWLKSCQSSREAWNLVWPLLDLSQTVNVQFTAANILCNKVTKQFGEVPLEEYGALKDKIIAAVARFVNGPPVVLTRLELALGAFIANTIGDVWPNPLEDLGSVFQPQNFPGVPEEKVLKLLVQTFAHVPEQAESVWQLSSRKGMAHRELQQKGDSVFTWLYGMVQAQQNMDMDVMKEAIKAMIPWIKMLTVCEWKDLNNLIDTLVFLCKKAVCLGDYGLCENCLELMSSIVADPNTHLYPTVVLTILHKIIPLQPTLDVVLELQDTEMAVTFYGMYVALADCHSRLIVDICDEECSYNKANPQNRENVLKLLDILLRCAGSPGSYPIDEVVSSITISVWYSFVEDIQAKQSEGLKYGRIMKVFEWVYKSLAEVLMRKAKFPEDDSGWNAEEKEQFRIYRQDVCDCIAYCFELRGWTMLNELIDTAELHLQTVESNPDQLNRLWYDLESLLMGIRAATENIADDRDPLLVAPLSRAFGVILRVLKVNQANRIPRLYQAALELISACSGMLHNFQEIVKNLVVFILEGLFIPDSSSSATLALKTMSRDCTKALSEFTGMILTSCKQALDSGSLTQNDSIRLVFCIGKFLPYLPHQQIITAVNEIFAPSLQHLHTIAEQEPKPEIRPELIVILKIMSTLCSSLDQCDSDDDDEDEDEMSESEPPMMNNNISSLIAGSSQGQVIEEVNPNVRSGKGKKDQSSQPLIPVVEQILPVLIPLAEKWSRDEEVMETLFSILKHTLTTIHTASSLVIEYAIKLVLISYRIHPVMPATGLAKQVLLMIGRENFHTQCQFLQQMHPLAERSLKSPRDNLEFAESYFIFMAHLVKNNTELVNASTISLDIMLTMALEIINYSEAPLLKAGIWFVQATINKASALAPPLTEFYRSHGLLLIQKIILAIGYVVPRSVVHHFSDIFLSLNRVFTSEWRRWLQDALAPPGFPSTHCTSDAKNVLFLKLTKERVNKRAVADAITDFALQCRNMSGSEYGVSTTKRF